VHGLGFLAVRPAGVSSDLLGDFHTDFALIVEEARLPQLGGQALKIQN
jgi:hypothetical protein